MSYDWFVALLGAAVLAVVLPMAWLWLRASEQQAEREAQDAFPGLDQDYERDTYQALRAAEMYGWGRFLPSRRYLARHRRDGVGGPKGE